MSLYTELQQKLPEFTVERVTLDNLIKYENIFYSNEDYYMITDGRFATKQDCIETIKYADDFPSGMGHSVGFSYDNYSIAFLSLFEGYPEKDMFYIGLFLMDKRFQRQSLGTKIINAVIDTAFSANYMGIKLSVQDNNLSGYPFWQKIGFKRMDANQCNGFNNISMKLNRPV